MTKITSAKFIKGIVDDDGILGNGTPQVAFIGRSNVGKSSLINSLTNTSVSRTSSFPGRTQEINLFLVNNSIYFVDLPGYGFARASGLGREKISELIDAYLFKSMYPIQKVVLIIDANVGMTDKDIAMFKELKRNRLDFVIAASKIDKMNQSEYHKKINEIKKNIGTCPLFPFSSKKKTGLPELISGIFHS